MFFIHTTDTLEEVRVNWSARPLLLNSTGADCKPGAGVAMYFLDHLHHRSLFPFGKKFEVGTVVYTKTEDTTVAWLLNKPKTREHPTDLKQSTRICLQSVKEFCLANGIKQMALPAIGAGLDKQPAAQIVDLIHEIFHDTDMQIIVSDPGRLISPHVSAYKAESFENTAITIMERHEQLPPCFEESYAEVIPQPVPILAHFFDAPAICKKQLLAYRTWRLRVTRRKNDARSQMRKLATITRVKAAKAFNDRCSCNAIHTRRITKWLDIENNTIRRYYVSSCALKLPRAQSAVPEVDAVQAIVDSIAQHLEADKVADYISIASSLASTVLSSLSYADTKDGKSLAAAVFSAVAAVSRIFGPRLSADHIKGISAACIRLFSKRGKKHDATRDGTAYTSPFDDDYDGTFGVAIDETDMVVAGELSQQPHGPDPHVCFMQALVSDDLKKIRALSSMFPTYNFLASYRALPVRDVPQQGFKDLMGENYIDLNEEPDWKSAAANVLLYPIVKQCWTLYSVLPPRICAETIYKVYSVKSIKDLEELMELPFFEPEMITAIYKYIAKFDNNTPWTCASSYYTCSFQHEKGVPVRESTWLISEVRDLPTAQFEVNHNIVAHIISVALMLASVLSLSTLFSKVPITRHINTSLSLIGKKDIIINNYSALKTGVIKSLFPNAVIDSEGPDPSQLVMEYEARIKVFLCMQDADFIIDPGKMSELETLEKEIVKLIACYDKTDNHPASITLLQHSYTRLVTKIVSVRRTLANTKNRQVPVGVVFFGDPGTGKTHLINNYLSKKLLDKEALTNSRVDSLQVQTKFYGASTGAATLFKDEAFVSDPNEDFFLKHVNNLISGFMFNYEGAFEKDRYIAPELVVAASNVNPNKIRFPVAVPLEGRVAVYSRLHFFEMRYVGESDAGTHRDAMQRDPDFSNIEYVLWEYDDKVNKHVASAMTMTTVQMVSYLAARLKSNRQNFLQQLNLVAQSGNINVAINISGAPRKGKTVLAHAICDRARMFGRNVSFVTDLDQVDSAALRESDVVVFDDILNATTKQTALLTLINTIGHGKLLVFTNNEFINHIATPKYGSGFKSVIKRKMCKTTDGLPIIAFKPKPGIEPGLLRRVGYSGPFVFNDVHDVYPENLQISCGHVPSTFIVDGKSCTQESTIDQIWSKWADVCPTIPRLSVQRSDVKLNAQVANLAVKIRKPFPQTTLGVMSMLCHDRKEIDNPNLENKIYIDFDVDPTEYIKYIKFPAELFAMSPQQQEDIAVANAKIIHERNPQYNLFIETPCGAQVTCVRENLMIFNPSRPSDVVLTASGSSVIATVGTNSYDATSIASLLLSKKPIPRSANPKIVRALKSYIDTGNFVPNFPNFMVEFTNTIRDAERRRTQLKMAKIATMVTSWFDKHRSIVIAITSILGLITIGGLLYKAFSSKKKYSTAEALTSLRTQHEDLERSMVMSVQSWLRDAYSSFMRVERLPDNWKMCLTSNGLCTHIASCKLSNTRTIYAALHPSWCVRICECPLATIVRDLANLITDREGFIRKDFDMGVIVAQILAVQQMETPVEARLSPAEVTYQRSFVIGNPKGRAFKTQISGQDEKRIAKEYQDTERDWEKHITGPDFETSVGYKEFVNDRGWTREDYVNMLRRHALERFSESSEESCPLMLITADFDRGMSIRFTPRLPKSEMINLHQHQLSSQIYDKTAHIHDNILKSMVTVSLVHSTQPIPNCTDVVVSSVCGIRIRQRFVLTVKHIVLGLRALGSDYSLYVKDDGVDGKYHKARVYANAEQKDLLIVEIENDKIPQSKDMVKYFITDSDVSSINDVTTFFPRKKSIQMSVGKAKVCTEFRTRFVHEFHGEITPISTKNSIEMDYFTQSGTHSVAGDCGAPYIQLRDLQNSKICGIHVAGSKPGAKYTTIAQIITQQDIEILLLTRSAELNFEPCDSSDAFLTRHKVLDTVYAVPKPMVPVMENMCNGTSPYHEFTHIPIIGHERNRLPSNIEPNKSFRRFQQTPFFPVLAPIYEHKVPVLGPDSNTPRNLKGKRDQLIEQIAPLDAPKSAFKIQDRVAFVNQLADKLRDVHSGYVEFSADDAINNLGRVDKKFNNLEPIDMSSTVGTLTSTYSNCVEVHDLVDINNEGVRSYKKNHNGEALRAWVNEGIKSVKNGVPVFNVYEDKLKYETRVEDKVRKPRAFHIGELPTRIIERAILGCDVGRFSSRRKPQSASYCCVGLDAMADFDKLANALRKYEKGYDFDFKKYDKTLAAELIRCYKDALCSNIIREGIKKNKTVAPLARAISTVVEQTINSVHEINGTWYRTHHGMPSGSVLTAVWNSHANYILFATAYLQLAYEEDIVKTLQDFDNDVVLFVYGDDVVMTINPAIYGWFTFSRIKHYIQNFGMHVTSSSKDDADVQLKPVHQLSFLSRTFVNLDGRWYGKLKEESLINRLIYFDPSTFTIPQMTSLCRDTLIEFTLYGKEKFNQFRDVIMRVYEDHYGDGGQLPSWERCVLILYEIVTGAPGCLKFLNEIRYSAEETSLGVNSMTGHMAHMFEKLYALIIHRAGGLWMLPQLKIYDEHVSKLVTGEFQYANKIRVTNAIAVDVHVTALNLTALRHKVLLVIGHAVLTPDQMKCFDAEVQRCAQLQHVAQMDAPAQPKVAGAAGGGITETGVPAAAAVIATPMAEAMPVVTSQTQGLTAFEAAPQPPEIDVPEASGVDFTALDLLKTVYRFNKTVNIKAGDKAGVEIARLSLDPNARDELEQWWAKAHRYAIPTAEIRIDVHGSSDIQGGFMIAWVPDIGKTSYTRKELESYGQFQIATLDRNSINAIVKDIRIADRYRDLDVPSQKWPGLVLMVTTELENKYGAEEFQVAIDIYSRMADGCYYFGPRGAPGVVTPDPKPMVSTNEEFIVFVVCKNYSMIADVLGVVKDLPWPAWLVPGSKSYNILPENIIASYSPLQRDLTIKASNGIAMYTASVNFRRSMLVGFGRVELGDMQTSGGWERVAHTVIANHDQFPTFAFEPYFYGSDMSLDTSQSEGANIATSFPPTNHITKRVVYKCTKAVVCRTGGILAFYNVHIDGEHWNSSKVTPDWYDVAEWFAADPCANTGVFYLRADVKKVPTLQLTVDVFSNKPDCDINNGVLVNRATKQTWKIESQGIVEPMNNIPIILSTTKNVTYGDLPPTTKWLQFGFPTARVLNDTAKGVYFPSNLTGKSFSQYGVGDVLLRFSLVQDKWVLGEIGGDGDNFFMALPAALEYAALDFNAKKMSIASVSYLTDPRDLKFFSSSNWESIAVTTNADSKNRRMWLNMTAQASIIAGGVLAGVGGLAKGIGGAVTEKARREWQANQNQLDRDQQNKLNLRDNVARFGGTLANTALIGNQYRKNQRNAQKIAQENHMFFAGYDKRNANYIHQPSEAPTPLPRTQTQLPGPSPPTAAPRAQPRGRTPVPTPRKNAPQAAPSPPTARPRRAGAASFPSGYGTVRRSNIAPAAPVRSAVNLQYAR